MSSSTATALRQHCTDPNLPIFVYILPGCSLCKLLPQQTTCRRGIGRQQAAAATLRQSEVPRVISLLSAAEWHTRSLSSLARSPDSTVGQPTWPSSSQCSGRRSCCARRPASARLTRRRRCAVIGNSRDKGAVRLGSGGARRQRRRTGRGRRTSSTTHYTAELLHPPLALRRSLTATPSCCNVWALLPR